MSKTQLIYFWHENDKFTLTSNNLIWTYPNIKPELTEKSIFVLPEILINDVDESSLKLAISFFPKIFGICSDFVGFLKDEK